VEKQLVDDFKKMFTETESFYYSNDYDITTSIQRQEQTKLISEGYANLPMWERTDRRFFWNFYMLESLLSAKVLELS
jgi:hypothetical protein